MISLKRLIFPFVALAALAAIPAIGQTNLMIPSHDIRIGVNLGMLEGALLRLSNTRYRGEYVHSGAICSSPDLEVDLGRVGTRTGGFQGFANGRGGAALGVGLVPVLKVSDCPLSPNFYFKCEAGGVLVDPIANMNFIGQCEFSLFAFFRKVFPLNVKVPPLIDLPRSFPIELVADRPDLTVQFGKFVGGNWVVDANPKQKVVDLNWTGAGRLGSPDLTPNDRTIWTADGGGRYYIDGSIGALRGNPVASKAEGVAAMNADDPVGDTGVVGFSLASSFFGKTSLDSPGSGFLDAVLPIRIAGKIKVSNHDLAYEVFLTAARSAYTIIEGKPAIILEIATEKASVFNLTVQKDHLVKEIGAQIVLEAPTVGLDGKITSRILQSSIHFSTFLGKACFCFNVPGLEKSFISTLPSIGQVKSSVALELPECIEVGEEKVQAQDRSWNIYQCRDHGGLYKGLIANIDQEKKTEIKLDLSKVTPVLSDDRLRLNYTVFPQ